MRIGIWLGKYNNPQIGGGFSYVDRLITAIDSYQFNPMVDICFISEGECLRKLKKPVIEIQQIEMSLLNRLLCKIPYPIFRVYYKGFLQKRLAEINAEKSKCLLKEKQVRLLYYIYPCICAIPDFPFISTNWDIGHCSTYAFPELASQAEYLGRDRWYRDFLPRALFVFSESEAGKEELIRYTTINTSKIKVVPIFAGDCVKQVMPKEKQEAFLNSRNLTKCRYFFYPAQFWAHKNHIGLLKAFSIFIKEYPDFKLVLTGSNQGTFSYVMKMTCQLNIQEFVSYLGFVSMEEMNTLYQNATSLVMTSYNGPTNMPPLEAMELGCPVICSDLAGHREELGDAAKYINPMDVNDIAKAMKEVASNRDNYIKRIKEQARKTYFTIENALNAIDKNLCEAVLVRENWD